VANWGDTMLEAVAEHATAIVLTLDRTTARSLSAQIAEKPRRDFAHGFTFAAQEARRLACRIAEPLANPGSASVADLSPETNAAAARLGTTLDRLDVAQAASLAGTICATALPLTYRTAPGRCYPPPLLVQRPLNSAEEANVEWHKAWALDSGCGAGTVRAIDAPPTALASPTHSAGDPQRYPLSAGRAVPSNIELVEPRNVERPVFSATSS
jgi:hypothetical protein